MAVVQLCGTHQPATVLATRATTAPQQVFAQISRATAGATLATTAIQLASACRHARTSVQPVFGVVRLQCALIPPAVARVSRVRLEQ